MPRSPQEQMAMTPEVFKFTREFGRGQQIEEKPSVIQQIAGTLGNVALAGAGIAGAYGLARALGPETDISPVSTGAMSDVGEPEDDKNYGNEVGTVGSLQEQPTDEIVVVEDPPPFGYTLLIYNSLK